MEREVHSQLASRYVLGYLTEQVTSNLWRWTYDFFKKSDAQLLGKTIYPLYVDLFKPNLQETQMARFRKRRRISRKRYKRRGRRSRRYGRMRRGIRKLYRKLKRHGIFNTEVKYRDDELIGQRIGAAHSTLLPFITFTNLSEGPEFQGRIGAKVFIRKIKIGMVFTSSNHVDAVSEQYIRWAIVRDTVPDVPSQAPFITEPFEFWYPNPANVNEAQLNLLPYKYVNNRQAKRFQYIWGGVTKVAKDTAAGYQRQFVKKIINVFKPCQYGNEDALADRGPGQLYMFFWSNAHVASNPPSDFQYPLVDVSYRISYTDT